jgi:hypothetical protein
MDEMLAQLVRSIEQKKPSEQTLQNFHLRRGSNSPKNVSDMLRKQLV